MYASPTKCTQVQRGVRNQKKKKKKTRPKWPYVFGIWLSSRGRHPCAHRLFLPKKSSHKFAVFFFVVNVMHFEGKWSARSFRIEKHANRPFRVRFSDCEISDFNSFVGNASTSTASGTASNLWSSHSWPDAFRRTSSWLLASWDC